MLGRVKFRHDAGDGAGTWYLNFWGQQEIENDEATTEHISQATPWESKGSKVGHIPTDRFSKAREMKLFFLRNMKTFVRAVN